MTAIAALLAALERTYREAVVAPGELSDAALEEAAGEALLSLAEIPSKSIARSFRAGVRRARRLRQYWENRDGSVLADWRLGVDEALGSRGWEPFLELAQLGLEIEPTEDLFHETRRLFRQVHFQPWMEDISFADWLDGRG